MSFDPGNLHRSLEITVATLLVAGCTSPPAAAPQLPIVSTDDRPPVMSATHGEEDASVTDVEESRQAAAHHEQELQQAGHKLEISVLATHLVPGDAEVLPDTTYVAALEQARPEFARCLESMPAKSEVSVTGWIDHAGKASLELLQDGTPACLRDIASGIVFPTSNKKRVEVLIVVNKP